MKEEIEVISKIKRKNLEERNYFETLIKEAYHQQLLTDDEMKDLSIQLLQLLEERVDRYRGLASSSIRKEIAEDIANSNSYTIGLYLKTFQNPDDAVKFIREKGLKMTYQEGRKRSDRMLSIIRVLQIKVKQNMLEIRNDIYHDTLINGIQGFLKIYDPDYKAQDMKITADYPLYCNLIGQLDGVEFIKEYLVSIWLENEFCKKFSEEKIGNLLYAYSHDYSDLIINIFEIVFLEAIGCKLAGKDIRDLSLSYADLERIELKLKNKTKEEIQNQIVEAYQGIRDELGLNSQELRTYMEKNLAYLVEVVTNATKQDTLNRIFLTQIVI